MRIYWGRQELVLLCWAYSWVRSIAVVHHGFVTEGLTPNGYWMWTTFYMVFKCCMLVSNMPLFRHKNELLTLEVFFFFYDKCEFRVLVLEYKKKAVDLMASGFWFFCSFAFRHIVWPLSIVMCNYRTFGLLAFWTK